MPSCNGTVADDAGQEEEREVSRAGSVAGRKEPRVGQVMAHQAGSRASPVRHGDLLVDVWRGMLCVALLATTRGSQART